MNTIYTKLNELEDKFKKDNHPFYYSFKNIFSQLSDIAFENPEKLDELPDEFVLKDAVLNSKEVISLMKKVGYDVTVELIEDGFKIIKKNPQV